MGRMKFKHTTYLVEFIEGLGDCQGVIKTCIKKKGWGL